MKKMRLRLMSYVCVVHTACPRQSQNLILDLCGLSCFSRTRKRRSDHFFFPVYLKQIPCRIPEGRKDKDGWKKWGGLWKEAPPDHLELEVRLAGIWRGREREGERVRRQQTCEAGQGHLSLESPEGTLSRRDPHHPPRASVPISLVSSGTDFDVVPPSLKFEVFFS